MKTHYQHLNVEERTLIKLGLQQRLTLRVIARSVNRAPSTISRECCRNGWSAPELSAKPGRPALAGGYRSVDAQHRATALLRKSRVPQKMLVCPAVRGQVFGLLLQRNSPEQIAGILSRMFPDNPAFNISNESIYSAIYAMPVALNAVGRFPTCSAFMYVRLKSMSVLPGRLECNLIKGKGNKSSVGTLVERTTLFVTLVLTNPKTDPVVDGFSRVFKRIDAQMRLSMTYDQGREMADHGRWTKETGVKVYFADPHSPWQSKGVAMRIPMV